GLAGHHAPRPARLHRIEEVDPIAAIVREDEIISVVLVEVDESQSGIPALAIDEAGALRECKRELRPGSRPIRPRDDGVLGVVAHEQLATAVSVQVTEPDPSVEAPQARRDGLTVDLQARQQPGILRPPAFGEGPGPLDPLAADHHRGPAIRTQDAEADAGIAAIILSVAGRE